MKCLACGYELEEPHYKCNFCDLRTQLSEALAKVKRVEGERDEALKYGAPEKDAKALSWVKEPCKIHNAYWTTHFGGCMACRATKAEAERDVYKAELFLYRKLIETSAMSNVAYSALRAEIDAARAATDKIGGKDAE